MKWEEYLQKVHSTNATYDTSRDYDRRNRINLSQYNANFIHAVLGLTTEAAELTDILKRNIYYGEDLDWNHVREELGDILWYLTLGIWASGASMDDIMKINVKKLQTRYANDGKFTEEEALKRDLQKERKVMKSVKGG